MLSSLSAAKKRVFWWYLRWSGVMLLIGLSLGGDSSSLSRLSNSLSTAALAAGDMAAAGATLVGIGANVSVALTTGSLGALTTGHSLATEAWHGVDVTNVTASRSTVRAFSRNSDDMYQYLQDDNVMGYEKPLLPQLLRCASNATCRVEVVDYQERLASHEGWHYLLHCRARVLPQGHLALAAVITKTTFVS